MYYAYKYHSAVVVKCIYETEQFMDDHSIRDGVKELHEGIDLDQPVSSFQCTYCKKCFSSRGNLNKHHKKIHSENDSTAENNEGTVHCMEEDCEFTCRYVSSLRDHLQSSHSIAMDTEKINFKSIEGV